MDKKIISAKVSRFDGLLPRITTPSEYERAKNLVAQLNSLEREGMRIFGKSMPLGQFKELLSKKSRVEMELEQLFGSKGIYVARQVWAEKEVLC
ncbi:MAG: hypothetical protein V1822_01845 [Candidatus Micrarchaeota archaeon]